MDNDSKGAVSGAIEISLDSISKFAKARAKELTTLQRALAKAEDDVEGVLKQQLDKAQWKAFFSKVRKLKKEFPTAGRFKQKLKAEVEYEVKRFEKLLEHAKGR